MNITQRNALKLICGLQQFEMYEEKNTRMKGGGTNKMKYIDI